MPYVVLWSSLDLNFVDSRISRISNACIESSNRVTKHIDFHGVANRSMADRVRELERSAEKTLGILELDAPLKAKAIREKPKYPKTEPNPALEEMWKGKKRRKGIIKVSVLRR